MMHMWLFARQSSQKIDCSKSSLPGSIGTGSVCQDYLYDACALVYLDLGDIQMAFEEHEQLTGQNETFLCLFVANCCLLGVPSQTNHKVWVESGALKLSM